MSEAIAIATIQTNPFKAAISSAKSCFALFVHFMYGSEDRVRITYAFALALLVLGYSMTAGAPSLSACAL